MFAPETFLGNRSAVHRKAHLRAKGSMLMQKTRVTIVVAGIATVLALAGCSSSKKSTSTTSTPASSPTSSSAAGGAFDGKGAKVGIILPDTQSSARWQNADLPALQAQCTKDNLSCDIQNAQGDKAKMKTIAEGMENAGVKVLMIVNLDAASGAAIEQEATSKGITTVDYDRLTPGGGAALYVSFDNVAVGTNQGKTLVTCPQVTGKSAVTYVDVNGSPTDNNATLFKQGYDGVLSKTAGWTKKADQAVPNWDNQQAGVIFGAMLRKNPSLNAVMVANDGMANSVIGVLKNQGLNGKVAVSGQDATAQGLQHILDGDQCFSIYKASALEAGPAIDAISTIVTGGVPKTNGSTEDPSTKKQVPSILAVPVPITIKNVAVPINDNYTPKSQVCTGAYVAKCTAAGVK